MVSCCNSQKVFRTKTKPIPGRWLFCNLAGENSYHCNVYLCLCRGSMRLQMSLGASRSMRAPSMWQPIPAPESDLANSFCAAGIWIGNSKTIAMARITKHSNDCLESFWRLLKKIREALSRLRKRQFWLGQRSGLPASWGPSLISWDSCAGSQGNCLPIIFAHKYGAILQRWCKLLFQGGLIYLVYVWFCFGSFYIPFPFITL